MKLTADQSHWLLALGYVARVDGRRTFHVVSFIGFATQGAAERALLLAADNPAVTGFVLPPVRAWGGRV